MSKQKRISPDSRFHRSTSCGDQRIVTYRQVPTQNVQTAEEPHHKFFGRVQKIVKVPNNDTQNTLNRSPMFHHPENRVVTANVRQQVRRSYTGAPSRDLAGLKNKIAPIDPRLVQRWQIVHEIAATRTHGSFMFLETRHQPSFVLTLHPRSCFVLPTVVTLEIKIFLVLVWRQPHAETTLEGGLKGPVGFRIARRMSEPHQDALPKKWQCNPRAVNLPFGTHLADALFDDNGL